MSVPPTMNALWSRRVHDYTKHSLPYFGLVTPASATIAFSVIPLLSLYYSLTMGRRSFWCGEDAQKSGVSVVWKVAICQEPMKKKTLNGGNTTA